MTFSVRGDKPVATTYETRDLDKFRFLPGNRPVDDKHIQQIVCSIERNGYLFDPIIVTHEGYVVDGQHRLEALRWLRNNKGKTYPVRYTYAKTGYELRLEECIVMNSNTVNWRVFNYIRAHAIKDMGGNQEEYRQLYEICQDYAIECGGTIPTTNIVQVAYKYWNKGTYTQVKRGDFKMGKTPEEVRAVLDYFVKFNPYRKKMSRRYELVSRLLWFVFIHEDIDEDRFFAQVKKVDEGKSSNINSFDNMEAGLKEITRIYNYGYGKMEKVELYPLYYTMAAAIKRKTAEEALAKKQEEKSKQVA